MRLATVLPSAAKRPTAVVATPENTWIEFEELVGRPLHALDRVLPWILENRTMLAEHAAAWTGKVYQNAECRFLPPVTPPAFRDFYAFEQHVKTARARRGLAMIPAWYELPVFYFSNHLALIGHEAEICAPAGSQELDYELELGIVIGRGGRDIAVEQAWEHVAGFTIVNDLSARDLQRQEMAVGLGPAKGKDFATAVGPWLVTRDEVADRIDGERLDLTMTARVNGRELSRGNVSSLYHSIPRLIAQASRDVTLYPGELLATGTVGTGCILELGPENTGGWLKPGDVVELKIERIGILCNRVIARVPTPSQAPESRG